MIEMKKGGAQHVAINISLKPRRLLSLIYRKVSQTDNEVYKSVVAGQRTITRSVLRREKWLMAITSALRIMDSVKKWLTADLFYLTPFIASVSEAG